MSTDIRVIAEDEFPSYTRTVQAAFGYHPTPEECAGWRSITELDRTLAAYDDDQIVATAGAFSFQLSVPGEAVIPAAGVTAVGVLPTHRRRGLLRSIMDRQLDDIVRAGDALAILTASESIIYGRFGYGSATSHASVAINPRRSDFAEPLADPGRIELLPAGVGQKVIADIHDRARLGQPGDMARSPAWWALTFADPKWLRRSSSQKFWAQHVSEAGEPDGYVAYRVEASWRDGLPDSEIEVVSLVGLNAQAELALWRFVFDLDLAARVVARSRPLDEPLRWRLADPRQLRTTAVLDQVWARLLDVPAALGARGYGRDEQIVIEVHDSFRPETGGTFRLQAGADGAECTRTGEPADISVGIAELSSAYLGQPRFVILAGAGRVVEHTPGALTRADQLFASATIPFCRSGF